MSVSECLHNSTASLNIINSKSKSLVPCNLFTELFNTRTIEWSIATGNKSQTCSMALSSGWPPWNWAVPLLKKGIILVSPSSTRAEGLSGLIGNALSEHLSLRKETQNLRPSVFFLMVTTILSTVLWKKSLLLRHHWLTRSTQLIGFLKQNLQAMGKLASHLSSVRRYTMKRCLKYLQHICFNLSERSWQWLIHYSIPCYKRFIVWSTFINDDVKNWLFPRIHMIHCQYSDTYFIILIKRLVAKYGIESWTLWIRESYAHTRPLRGTR